MNKLFDSTLPEKPGNNLITFQWHITERCNLRYTHCYQGQDPDLERPLGDLAAMLGQMRELLTTLRSIPGWDHLKGHVNITGGEPFFHRDFASLMEILRDEDDHLSYSILTNGTLIDDKMAKKLKCLLVSSVQVSLEGSEKTNDAIRGKGSFRRAADALKHLVREGIPTSISFTAHGGNFREFPHVARLGMDLGVSRVWADRLIPEGNASNMKDQVLSPDDTREFLNLMADERLEADRRFSKTEIYMKRALQFLVSGGRPYRCGAGEFLVTIMPNGELYPCRRLPVSAGNIVKNSLKELYFSSPVLRSLRSHRISAGCEDCNFNQDCRGGLRCLSYAVTGDLFQADPGCWRARSTLETRSVGT